MKKLIEWEVVSHCNYNCSYCVLPNIKMERDETKLKKFMDNLDKSIELFLFGGEPFLHPKIDFIISYLEKINQPFVIQSNLSTKSTSVCMELNSNTFNLQGSIHPSEISVEEMQKNLKVLKNINANLRRLDIMYVGKESIKYYKVANDIFPNICYLLPISGFYETDSCALNIEYNKIKKRKVYSWIKFEKNFISELNKERSDVWEEQCLGKFSTYGKPCPYDYTLHDSKLNKYNCCYRENTNGICNHKGCFWM